MVTTQAQPSSGVITQTLPDGTVVTSSSGLLVWGSNKLTVPTGLTAPETTTALGETFTFQPTGPIPTGTAAGSSNTGIAAGSSNTGTAAGSTNTGTAAGSSNTGTAAGSTTGTGALVTYTTWPSVVSIIPVTTSVDAPQASDNKPVIPCKAWFFFICISWDLNIGGWQLNLPPGIYPPGPPPGLQFPPSITIPGILPPWPPITIGNNNVPTYSDEPTSCETSSATMFLTTTSFEVSATQTTATQILSTSSIIIGCDIQDQSSAATTTTSACPTAATTCSGAVITLSIDSNDPPLTIILDTNDALATSVYDFVMSFWSDEDAAASTTMVTSTLPSGAISTLTAMSTAAASTTLPSGLPTLTAMSTAPATTLPIVTSDDSSCLSTVTTSICSIPQEPCGASLSCASWTATTALATSAAPSSTGAAPTPTSTWHMTLYDVTCAKQSGSSALSYYSLTGYEAQSPDETCISLQHGLPTSSATSNSCVWFPGDQDCSAGTFTKPHIV
ncbi:hypothetical protein NA56DRAFT_77873 [Hyaloscypha hepaticicola]|uniref:Secreted LysM effector LysM C-terminal domain-containing protein n=1 Tax=Hyaloscypha hepaticicola TaxID=2082293 RepID=A0A2J6Q9E2_9HELO|nr:hypothetical protein NA56DRAFT_77873 [Hyaloscypha hepaticicola]